MIIISAQAFPPKPGGIQNLLAGTAEYVAKAGYEVLVLADGDAKAASWDKTQDHPYKIERFGGFKPLRRRKKAGYIKRLCETGKVKAIYADSWKSVELLQKPKGIPLLTWAHGNEFPKDVKKGPRIRKALSKVDCVIFNSRETRARALYALPEGAPNIIVNPPIFSSIEPSQEDIAGVERVWNGAAPRFLSMCRLIEWKGIDRAIEALPDLLPAFPNLKYVVAGVGDDLERLQGLAELHGVRDHVHFQGWIEGAQKTAFLRSADLFLQPGRQVVQEREGFGITYVEAALEGLPTLSGNAGGAPEAIVHGETGLVIDASTSATPLIEAMTSLLTNKEQLTAMKAASRAHGEANLWKNQISRILAAADLKRGPIGQ